MELPLDGYDCSAVLECENDVVIQHHQEYYSSMYRFECGKTFVEICKELGLDKEGGTQISML